MSPKHIHSLLSLLLLLLVLQTIKQTNASTDFDCSTWPTVPPPTPALLFVDCPAYPLLQQSSLPYNIFAASIRYMDLSGNALTGSINSTESATPTKLIYLDLSENDISGSLPSTFAPTLSQLDLSSNQFSGPLPSTWNSSKALRSIKLAGNVGINGSLPESWNSLTNLVSLDLTSTQISGPFPSWHSLTLLKTLLVTGLNLTGCVPTEIPSFSPSPQISGYVLEKCTGAPSTSPSMAPTSSKPTKSPSRSPSHTPTKRPSLHQISLTFQPSVSPTQPGQSSPTFPDQPPPSESSSNSTLGIAIGASMGVIGVLGLVGFAFYKYSQHKERQRRKIKYEQDAEAVPDSRDWAMSGSGPAGSERGSGPPGSDQGQGNTDQNREGASVAAPPAGSISARGPTRRFHPRPPPPKPEVNSPARPKRFFPGRGWVDQPKADQPVHVPAPPPLSPSASQPQVSPESIPIPPSAPTPSSLPTPPTNQGEAA